VAFGLKSVPCSVKYNLEVIRAINGKHGVFDIVSGEVLEEISPLEQL
jgi:hypothetical protein